MYNTVKVEDSDATELFLVIDGPSYTRGVVIAQCATDYWAHKIATLLNESEDENV